VSQDNVEIVRRGIEAAIRRPEPDFDTMNALFHPNHEFVSAADSALEGGSHRGMGGYRAAIRDLEETVASRSRLEQVTEIDEDRVLAIMPTRFEGRSSGVAFDEERLAAVVTLREGKIVRTKVYLSAAAAIKAVGLEK
jgi:ketosteroid isomerase-like protein